MSGAGTVQTAVCERCGELPAILHWTEAIEGTVIELHLCERCCVEDPPGELPDFNVLRFQCPCGEALTWRFPHGGCGHPAEAYERAGRRETEIASCSCGVRYVTVGMRWTCRICGTESVTEPRPGGELGYLLEHVHGARAGAEITIRGVMP